MSLKLTDLENVKRRGDKTTAACPACRAEGADGSGDHLVIFDDGRFGCAVHPKDAAHRRRIWQLVGDPDSLPKAKDLIQMTVNGRIDETIVEIGKVTLLPAQESGTASTPKSRSVGTSSSGETLPSHNCHKYSHGSTATTAECDLAGDSELMEPLGSPATESHPEVATGAVSLSPLQNPPLKEDSGGTPVPLPTPRETLEGSDSGVVAVPEAIYCTTRSDLTRIAEDLEGADRIALDLETYGTHKGDALDPWRGDIRLLSLRRDGGSIWLIDLHAIGYDLGPLARVLTKTSIIAHNAKFDLLWLRVKCRLHPSSVRCTLTASRLLTAGDSPGNGLDACLQRHLSIPPGANMGRSDWGGLFLIGDQIDYAARDVAHLHALDRVLGAKIEQAGLTDTLDLENRLLPDVVDMEAAGILVEPEKLQAVADEADAEAELNTARLREALGDLSLNPNSHPQLLAALRARGLEIESTSEDALKEADDNHIVPLILAHRKAAKRFQQAESLLEHAKGDGRIHARFEPTGTVTGRFSSKEPNLQNVCRGSLREAFVAPPGHQLVVADYSQIELRAAAAIAGEPRMIEAYRAGEDLHRKTAAAVLGIEPDGVQKQQRQLAKAVNFGLLYGQSASGLVGYAASSYGVELTEEEAGGIRNAFFRAYPKLWEWHQRCHRLAKRNLSEVRARTGRRRLLPKSASHWNHFTALVNTPVQGVCADGMKQAIVLLAERLPEGSRILSTVHDEVIVETTRADAEMIRELVAETMKEAMASLLPEVPIEVEADVCTHWGGKG